jgi:hypothetical protein
MEVEALFALVFTLGMFAGVFIIYMGLRQRSLQLEMQHKERMAMIERGQVPLSDPDHAHRRSGTAGARSLSIGIVVVGLGLALMTLISVAGESPEIGIGVGGAVAILGAAFIVRNVVVPSGSSVPPSDPDGR